MDQAEAVWAQVKELLRPEVPRALFDSWVRESEGIGLSSGELTVGVTNSYAREWLEQNLSLIANRVATAVLDRPVQVRFLVWQDEAPLDETALTGEGKSGRVEVDLVLSSLRDLFTRSWQVVAIEGYFRRWLPFLGPTLAWIVVALRQKLYLATSGDPAEGLVFQTSMQEIAKWSGLTKRTVLNHLKDPESLRKLSWFLSPVDGHGAARSGDGRRRRWVTYQDGHGRRRGKPPANRYQFQALMPLTPWDAQALLDRLLALGARSDPVSALEQARKIPRDELLPKPLRIPEPTDLNRRPQPQSVHDVVRAACGKLDQRTSELADRLAAHIMPRKDRIMPSHYLLRHWLPTLGPGPGWAVTLLQDERFSRERRNELEGDGWWTRENPYDEIARWLGLSRSKTVQEWFAFDKGRGKKSLLEKFARLRRTTPQGDGREAGWRIEVEALDPLIPVHQEAYEELVATFEALQHSLEPEAGADFTKTWDGVGAFISMIRDKVGADFTINPVTSGAFFTMNRPAAGRDFHRLKHEVLEAILQTTSRGPSATTTGSAPLPAHQETPVVVEHLAPVPGGRHWDLAGLLQHNRIAPRLCSRLLAAGASAPAFVSWLLHAASPRGTAIRDPLAHAVSRLSNAPQTGAGEPYDSLAALPQSSLLDLIRRSLDGSTRWTGNKAWAQAMHEADPDRLRNLANHLALPLMDPP